MNQPTGGGQTCSVASATSRSRRGCQPGRRSRSSAPATRRPWRLSRRGPRAIEEAEAHIYATISGELASTHNKAGEAIPVYYGAP